MNDRNAESGSTTWFFYKVPGPRYCPLEPRDWSHSYTLTLLYHLSLNCISSSLQGKKTSVVTVVKAEFSTQPREKAENSTSFHPFIYRRPTMWFLSSGNTRMLFQSLISWHRREHHAIWTGEHHFPATGLRTPEEQKLARSPLPIHEVADEPPHHSLKMYYPTRPKTKGSSQSFMTSKAPSAIPSLSLPLNAQIYF